MRPTTRCLQALEHLSHRSNSTSFIGLGRMGREMALNLFSKQYAVASNAQFIVCDALPESSQSFCDSFLAKFPGAKLSVVKTPEEAAMASQTVITMLPSSPQVQSVYSGGIIPALKSMSSAEAQNTICIDSTTLDVSVARRVAEDVIGRGAQMVDAPVSGGVVGAQAGTLSFLVGGSKGAYAVSHPTLALMGQRIIHCGPSGAGLGAKICNNLVLGVQQIVVAEAMLLGGRLGLDPAVLAGVINSSTGGCWASSVNNPVPSALPDKSPPCERNYEGGFATPLMLKDMGLATAIGKETGSPLPLGEAAESIYSDALTHSPGLGKKDFSSVYQHLEMIAHSGTN